MQLELYESDVLPEFQHISTRFIEYKHFTPEAQEAIKVVGRSLFRRDTGTTFETYNAVWHKDD